METRIDKYRQSEIATITHNGHSHAAGGYSMDGTHIIAYDGGNGNLTRFSGDILCRCRRKIVRAYRNEWGDKSAAVIFRLPRSRFIIGYTLGAGMVFRGEAIHSDEDDAKRWAISISESMIKVDQEDEARFQDEQDTLLEDAEEARGCVI